MTIKSWTLTDRTERTYLETLAVNPEDVGGPAHGYSIRKHQLRGGPSDGVDIVHVDNGLLRFAVLPTRGMGIWKAWIEGDSIGWHSPVPGPMHPALVPLTDPSGLGWLDGFDELLVRCGMESNGAPEFDDQGRVRYPLHGRIANKPAHYVKLEVDGEAGEISLHGIVDEVRFHFFKLRLHSRITTRVGQPWLEISDTIENLSASPTDVQMLYHVNFGTPWLDPGATLVAPIKTVVPRDARAAEDVTQWLRYPEPVAGSTEQVYYCSLLGDEQQNTAVLLKNSLGTRGVSLHFNTRQLPCFTQWKNVTAEADGYVTGLEPGTNFPNTRSYETEQGRVLPLAPGATSDLKLRMTVHPSADEVHAAEAEVVSLQSEPLQIMEQPQPGWCENA